MAKPKKPAKAATVPFKTVELSAMPSPRTPADFPAIERALEFAQTLNKRAVIAFEGAPGLAARFREQTMKLLKRSKRIAFYRVTRRKGQVFIWRATELIA